MGTLGNKRKPTTKGKPASDFKRLKAKVGKKVAKAVNETDTSFRKASLYVSHQSMTAQPANAILSQKGRSLADLSLQFGHPAGTARHSVVKGLINIVKENAATNLRAHLHCLIQIGCKALVDDQDAVRKAGYTLLAELMIRNEKSTLVPFKSLLVAYTSSSLHSLDRDMRFDGAKAVGLICSFFGPLLHESILALLPPFVSLLSDRERKKDFGIILESLVALLSIPVSSNQLGRSFEAQENLENQTTNYLFLAGGRSRNAVIQQNQRFTQHSEEIGALARILSTNDEMVTDNDQFNSEKYHKLTEARSLYKTVRDIQVKLCDVLVEMIDEESEDYSSTRKFQFSFEEVKSLMQAIQVTYTVRNALNCRDQNPTISLDIRTANSLLEIFPIKGDAKIGVPATSDRDDTVNAVITRTLLNLVLAAGNVEGSKDWIEKLLTYWLPSVPANGDIGMSAIQVEVVQEILQSLPKQVTIFTTFSHKIHQELHKCFFKSPDKRVARSLPGRKAAVMLADICLYQVMEMKEVEAEDQTLMALIQCLPFYLKAWSVDFENDSSKTIDALRSIATYGSHVVRTLLRDNVSSILDKETDGDQPPTSLFEKYSPKLQMSFLGLIRVLESPPRSALRALAVFCVSGNDKNESRIDDEIVVMVSSIRKTIPMTDYFSFLIGSMGVPSNGSEIPVLMDENEFELTLLSLDHRVMRAAKAIVECGSLNSLKMLKPQLLKWMEIFNCDDPSVMHVLRSRASLCLLSLLILDLRRMHFPLDDIADVGEILELCFRASRNLLIFLSKMRDSNPYLEGKFLSTISSLAGLSFGFADKLESILHGMPLGERETGRSLEIMTKLKRPNKIL